MGFAVKIASEAIKLPASVASGDLYSAVKEGWNIGKATYDLFISVDEQTTRDNAYIKLGIDIDEKYETDPVKIQEAFEKKENKYKRRYEKKKYDEHQYKDELLNIGIAKGIIYNYLGVDKDGNKK